MNSIALAILIIGLIWVNAYTVVNNKNPSPTAGFVAFVATMILFYTILT